MTTIGGHRFHHRVFLTPPWPEIYVTDPERTHGLAAAVAEYEHLRTAYPKLEYQTIVLPKVSVAKRAASSKAKDCAPALVMKASMRVAALP